TAVANLVVSATSANLLLVPLTNISLGGSGQNRTVTITPSPDQFGTGVITLTVTDTNAASASSSFRVIVNPINDAPTLSPIADLITYEDGGTQYVVLSGISSGAANENQILTVTASNGNPALVTNLAVSYFSPDPAGIL